jgi:RNase adapter protein RapZ
MVSPSPLLLGKKQSLSVIIITGLSGAGKLSFMRALEDIGFYCVDNLPVLLFAKFINLVKTTQGNITKIALGIDSRGRSHFGHLLREIKKTTNIDVKIVFLNASTETFIKRFQETRRKHPLGEKINIVHAIEKERVLLEPIKKRATIILDTNVHTVHDLRKWVQKAFSRTSTREMTVSLISFGFKYGIPPESNLIYDIRFLPNPYFISDLKHLNGINKKVQQYLFSHKTVISYLRRFRPFMFYTLDKFYREGRSFANISIGCTGGKHRSVSFVEKLKKEKIKNIVFVIYHRDLGKE